MKLIFLILSIVSAQELKKTYLTIYSDNFSIVSQYYETSCPKNGEIKLLGMPRNLIPDSLSILMDGRKVRSYIYSTDYNGYSDRKVEILTEDNTLIKGVIKADSDPCIVIDEKGNYLSLNRKYIKYINYGNFDEKEYIKQSSNNSVIRIISEPSKNGSCAFNLRYMLNSLGWKCNYDAYIDEDENRLDIVARINVNNSSGYDFKNASVMLISGSVNRNINPPQIFRAMSKSLGSYEMDAAQAEITPQAVSDYYSYRLPGNNLTLESGDNVSYELFSRNNIKFEKYYVYKGQMDMWYFYDNISNYRSDKKLTVSFRFKNSKDNMMDMPLPEGNVRIYMKKDGFNIFAGEDHIKNTPIDSDLEINSSKAFDVEGERKIVEHKKIIPNVYRDTVEIKIRNEKKQNIKVQIKEYLWGRWKIIESSHNYNKKDANNIEFIITVPAKTSQTVKYTAEYDFNN